MHYSGLDYFLYLTVSMNKIIGSSISDIYSFVVGNVLIFFLCLILFNLFNKKAKIIIISFSLIFFIFLAIYTNFLKARDQEIAMAVANYEDLMMGLGMSDRPSEYSISNMDIDTCEKISLYNHYVTGRSYNDCVVAVATNKNDATLCTKMDCSPEDGYDNYFNDGWECMERCLSSVAGMNNGVKDGLFMKNIMDGQF